MLTSTNHGPTATPEQEPMIHDEYDNIVSDVRKKLIKVLCSYEYSHVIKFVDIKSLQAIFIY